MQHTINLIYNAAQEGVTSKREPIPMQVGDTVVFQSDAGPVHIKLAPSDVFSAPGYHTGMPPLELRKRSKFHFLDSSLTRILENKTTRTSKSWKPWWLEK